MTDLPSSLASSSLLCAPTASGHRRPATDAARLPDPRRSLESLDLFTQLGLLSLFGAYHFVDILQEKPPLLT